MSRSKATDLRGLSQDELSQKRNGLEKELFELRQKKIVGQLEKPSQFRAARRQIAQINTVLREKKK